MRGILEVADQSEALKRIKEMGLFPTRVLQAALPKTQRRARPGAKANRRTPAWNRQLFGGRVKPSALTVFTRQLATLVEAGMPLLRGLKILEEQEGSQTLKNVIGELAEAIESGSSCAEAVAMHPKIFNPLYVNMVRAGEISGALDVTLERLAHFQEKAQKIKGKVKSAMFYPCAVMTVAMGILAVLVLYVIPKFKLVFDGLMNGRSMPTFTVFVFRLSEIVKSHTVLVLAVVGAAVAAFVCAMQTKFGRLAFDYFKLKMPVL